MRKPVAVATTAVLLSALAALASPAQAADGTTAVSFVLPTGSLTIQPTATAPQATAQLGSSGATATVPLGTTTVKDTRAIATSWSMSVTASDFTTTGATIPKTAASFSVQAGWSVPEGSFLPVFTKAPSTVPAAANSSGSLTLITTTLGVLNNGLTFTPVLTVSVPSGSPAGTYTGTVTQSVS